MNNRDYKQFAPNHYYHIYNRGNGKMDIFIDDQDFLNFYKRLKLVLGMTKIPFAPKKQRESLSRIQPLPFGAFSILCNCLMPNHFHFLIRQNTELPLSKLISKVMTSYSKYFNKKYNHIGGVFQDAFKAVLVENDSYLLWLSAYIHQNPKVAGFVKKTEEYKWSSYPDYLGERSGTLCEKGIILKQFADIAAYQKFVENSFGQIRARKDLENLLLDS